jgi:hypothetical protein
VTAANAGAVGILSSGRIVVQSGARLLSSSSFTDPLRILGSGQLMIESNASWLLPKLYNDQLEHTLLRVDGRLMTHGKFAIGLIANTQLDGDGVFAPAGRLTLANNVSVTARLELSSDVSVLRDAKVRLADVVLFSGARLEHDVRDASIYNIGQLRLNATQSGIIHVDAKVVVLQSLQMHASNTLYLYEANITLAQNATWRATGAIQVQGSGDSHIVVAGHMKVETLLLRSPFSGSALTVRVVDGGVLEIVSELTLDANNDDVTFIVERGGTLMFQCSSSTTPPGILKYDHETSFDFQVSVCGCEETSVFKLIFGAGGCDHCRHTFVCSRDFHRFVAQPCRHRLSKQHMCQCLWNNIDNVYIINIVNITNDQK